MDEKQLKDKANKTKAQIQKDVLTTMEKLKRSKK